MMMITPLPNQYLFRYLQRYPQAIKTASDLRQVKDDALTEWPDWCYLPLAASQIIAQEEAKQQRIDTSHANEVGNIGALLAWQQTQGNYRFHSAVHQHLWETDIRGEIPVEFLYRLPEWCVWVNTAGAKDPESRGYFGFLEYDANTQKPELRLAIDQPNSANMPGTLLHHKIPLDHSTIEMAFGAALASTKPVQSQTIELLPCEYAKLIAPRISLLLYLCASNTEIRNAHGSSSTPGNPQAMRTDQGMKILPATQTQTWEVGYRMGATLEKMKDTPNRPHWKTRRNRARKPLQLTWQPPTSVEDKESTWEPV